MSKTILESPEYLSVTYSEDKAPYGKYPFLFGQYLLKNVFKKPGRLLDLGCGRGEYIKVFSDLGFDPLGLDISPKILEYLEGYNVALANLEEGTSPCEENSCDFAFSKSVIEHMNNPMGLLKVSFNVLKPGGTAVIMTPSWAHNHKEAFYIDHTHVTPFTKPSLSDALEMAGYKDIEVSYFYQLPAIWKFPWLKYLSKATSLFPIPYAPLNDVPWKVSGGFNKYIRFSKEVMLFATAKKY
tara:strand:+ start:301 stop:1020 length:720 start_codon:yes stop_codon:yes gene_type:complete